MPFGKTQAINSELADLASWQAAQLRQRACLASTEVPSFLASL
jgi:hypothetical protein